MEGCDGQLFIPNGEESKHGKYGEVVVPSMQSGGKRGILPASHRCDDSKRTPHTSRVNMTCFYQMYSVIEKTSHNAIEYWFGLLRAPAQTISPLRLRHRAW